MTSEITIAGGGASGVLLAANILREDPRARVTLYEPSSPGRGIAYSTVCEHHLLNVPAGNMSAFVDEPAHFLEWLEAAHPGSYGPASFVPRAVYGAYLSDIARTFARDMTHVPALATIDDVDGTGAFVLATGHATVPRSGFAPASSRYVANPWSPEAASVGNDRDEPIIILGSGLTAVDIVLALRGNGHRGEITMLSKRGLLPHEHRFGGGESDWRHSVDALRPITNERWQAMSIREKRRFLRHMAPYWNVHRHRMAPQTAREIARLLAAGTLRVLAGRVQSIEEREGVLRLTARERRSPASLTLEAARIVDCTGPQPDLGKVENPLLRALVERGLLVPHPVGAGSVVATNGATVDVHENASDRLFTIGPMRFGTLFETTAIPEIRVQAKELARLLTSDSRRDPVIARDRVWEVVR